MKFKKIWLTSFLLILLLIGIAALRHGKWDRYYKNKLDQPPRQVVIKALSLFEVPGKAIDIGFGVGNETILMLNSGWQVWAIDSEPKAIQIINQRKDIKDSRTLFAAVANFEENSTWDMLPQVDFISASYALPFCNRHNFEKVWAHIKQKINSGGRFAGHFFGLNYQGFTEKEMKQMTFFTKEEILNLLQDFDIEYFQEVEEDSKSGTGKAIHSHIFEVIVQNKSQGVYVEVERSIQNIELEYAQLLTLVRKAFPNCQRLDNWKILSGGALNTTYKFHIDSGAFVLRIYARDQAHCKTEKTIHELIDKSVSIPKLVYADEAYEPWAYSIFEFISGVHISELPHQDKTTLSYELGHVLASIHAFKLPKAGLFGDGIAIGHPFGLGSSPYFEETNSVLSNSKNVRSRLGEKLTDKALTFIHANKGFFPTINNDNICLTHSDFKPVMRAGPA